MSGVCKQLVYGICMALALATEIHCHWLSTPGSLCQCVGEDACFNWNTDHPATLTFWLNSITGNTILSYARSKNTTKFYDRSYQGRVVLLHGTNSGIKLMNVAKHDTGSYSVKLVGSGDMDTASLTVVTESDLKPDLYINKEKVSAEKILISVSTTQVHILITTSRNLSADINITIEGRDTLGCQSSPECSDVINFPDSGSQILVVHYTVDYNICHPQRSFIVVERISNITDENPTRPSEYMWPHPSQVTPESPNNESYIGMGPESPNYQSYKNMYIAIVVGILSNMLTVLIIIIWHRRKLKGASLNGFQKINIKKDNGINTNNINVNHCAESTCLNSINTKENLRNDENNQISNSISLDFDT